MTTRGFHSTHVRGHRKQAIASSAVTGTRHAMANDVMAVSYTHLDAEYHEEADPSAVDRTGRVMPGRVREPE